MGKKRDLTAPEKAQTVRDLASGISTQQIAKNLDRDHRTIKIIRATSTRKRRHQPKFKTISQRQLTYLKREVAKAPLSSSKALFERISETFISKATRCRILTSISKHVTSSARPFLTKNTAKIV